jgi:hypothetical protein
MAMGRTITHSTSTTHPPWRRWRVRAIALGTAVTVSLAACGGNDADESAGIEQTPNTAAAAEAADDVLTGADGGAEAPAATIPTESGSGGLDATTVAGNDLATLGRDIAIEMHVTMTSDDLRRTVQGIMRSAAAHGGAVFASDIDYGDGPDGDAVTGRATLTVKVPPAELGAVLSGLDELGTVLSTNQQAQDVTDQLVDLAVRIRNAEQSVDRVREFLETTTDLRQMVDLEGELTRRQTDLERLLATQANLDERVALSTLTIDVQPAAAPPNPVDDGSDGIGDAFRSGWNAFLGALFAVGFVLAILAPFLALAALVLVIAWIVARPRWRRPATAAPPATTEPAAAIAADAVSDDEDLARTNRPG